MELFLCQRALHNGKAKKGYHLMCTGAQRRNPLSEHCNNETELLQVAGQARMDSFTAASAKRALGSLQSVRWTSDAPGFSNVHVHYVGRTGVCGNGLCEVCSPEEEQPSHLMHITACATAELCRAFHKDAH